MSGPVLPSASRATSAVLFDLDGTLVDSERQNMRALERVMATLGRPLDAAEAAFVVGHGWREIGARLAERAPLPLPLPEIMERAGHERARLVAAEGEHQLPGARRLIEIARRVAKVGLVSGSSRHEIIVCLAQLGVTDSIEVIVGAEDVQRGKPEPEGYLLAAEKLGILPARCLVFEDSTAGIFAARAAGMHVVGVAAGNFAQQDQSCANELLPSLEDCDHAWIAARLASLDAVSAP